MSSLAILPAVTLAAMEQPFILIALGQAAVVFFLCVASKSRVASVAIGVVGSIVVSLLGSNRYAALDVVLVVLATLAAIWKLTPSDESESQSRATALAGQAAGGAVLLIACVFGGLWLYVKMGSQPLPTPVVNQAPTPGPAVAQPSPPKGFGSEAITVVSEETRLEKLTRANAEAESLLGTTVFQYGDGGAVPVEPLRTKRRDARSDKRHCLKFRDSAAVARCAGE